MRICSCLRSDKRRVALLLAPFAILILVGWVPTEVHFRLVVEDEEGRPVPTSEAAASPASRPAWFDRQWQPANEAGVIDYRWLEIRPDVETEPAFDVVVRAPGFAHTLSRVEMGEEKTHVRLERGRRVQVRMRREDGQPLKDSIRPVLYTEETERLVRDRVWRPPEVEGVPVKAAEFVAFPEPKGDGLFEIPLREDADSFHILVSPMLTLELQTEGPFDALSEEEHLVVIPESGTLSLRIVISEEVERDGTLAWYRFFLMREREGGEPWLGVEIKDVKPASGFEEEYSVMPGRYSLQIEAYADMDPWRRYPIQKTVWRGTRQFEVNAGETLAIVQRAEPIDPSLFQGEHTALLTLLSARGEPIAGESYVVIYRDRTTQGALVTEGVVPQDGKIRLEGLADNGRHGAYLVVIDDVQLGQIRFPEGEQEFHQTMRIPPTVGDYAPDIEVLDVLSGEEVAPDFFEGKVVYLDFWATWCGPCQGPMAELNEFAREQPAHWQDRVVLAGVSIDSRRSVLERHVRAHSWTDVRHFWAQDGKGFQTAAAEAYGISGVPTALLIDRDGIIAWRGHPGSKGFDLAERIEDLLAAE